MQKWVVQDVMLFNEFDWTMASIIAFDWPLKYGRHTSSICVHLTCFTDTVFAVSEIIMKYLLYQSIDLILSGQYEQSSKLLHQIIVLFTECIANLMKCCGNY